VNVLLTGFEPFDREALNPSWEAVSALEGWRCEGAVVHARRISCVFGAALRELDAAIGDNAGCQPIDVPVVAGAPAAYFSTLPIKAMVRDLRVGGIPASVSNSAGTFVCNHLFFGLMHRISTRPVAAGLRGGFIHIPYLPEQAARVPGMPSMALDTVVAALRIALATALAVREDIRETGGQLS